MEEPVLSESNTSITSNENILEINASKTDFTLSTLSLTYSVPESLSIGTNIQFIIKITSEEASDDSDENLVLEDTVTLIVVQNTSDTTEKDENASKPSIDEQDPLHSSDKASNFSNTTTYSEKTSFTSKSATQISGANSSNNLSHTSDNNIQETVSYLGSQNNYLSDLYIEGFSFSKDFSKTNFTYFATVPSNITSLDIKAIAEENTSTICIYGNNDLNSATNKILVTVTAENGNVRTYRIYVTRQ